MENQTLIHLFGLNHRIWSMNLEGIAHPESLVQPRPAGNCLNWVAGHVVATRNLILQLLGREPIWHTDSVAQYGRGASLGEPEGAESIDTIRDMWTESQRRILEGLESLSPEAAAAPSESDLPGDTIAENLAFLHLHESYHLGQLGLLRRMAGKDGAIA